MSDTRTSINRVIRRFMEANRLTQRGMAALVGMPPATFHRRITGEGAWTDENIDSLRDAGVPLALSAYSLGNEEVTA